MPPEYSIERLTCGLAVHDYVYEQLATVYGISYNPSIEADFIIGAARIELTTVGHLGAHSLRGGAYYDAIYALYSLGSL